MSVTDCRHGIEPDICCPDCELSNLNQTIQALETVLVINKTRRKEVVELIKAQAQILNDALKGTM